MKMIWAEDQFLQENSRSAIEIDLGRNLAAAELYRLTVLIWFLKDSD